MQIRLARTEEVPALEQLIAASVRALSLAFYTPEQIEQLARIVAALEQREGTCRAAAFRDASGLGRKRAIQVLEFFDRIGYTRRAGAGHRLRQAGLVPAWANCAAQGPPTA